MSTNIEKIVDEAMDLLHEYRYNDIERDYVMDIIETWERNKATLLEKFRKHPNWSEEDLAIVLDAEYSRPFNTGAPYAFADYVEFKAKQFSINSAVKEHNGQSIQNLSNKKETLLNKLIALKQLAGFGYMTSELQIELCADIQEIKYILDQYAWDSSEYEWVPKAAWEKYVAWRNVANVIRHIQEGEDKINERLSLAFEQVGVKAPVGAKTSRVIRKALVPYGIFEDTQRNSHGSLICEQRFAEFADGINPLKVKTKTYISLNPLDYWTMSFGDGWSSCHTIDVYNTRGSGLNGTNTYHGCYSAGTESYMLDESTVIVYTGEMMRKIKRCNFHINEDGSVIIEGRVYPDARDEGVFAYAPQLRQIVQDIVSACWNVPNNWSVKKGISYCSDYIKADPDRCNYDDYFNYNDCNVSLNIASEMHKKVLIGHEAICPICGHSHNYHDNICCDECMNDTDDSYGVCEYCEESFYESDDYVHTRDDHYYCCETCAREAGYRYCVDINEWSDSCERDDYDDEYYYYDMEVFTTDGHQYSCEENARADGYEHCEDTDEWVRKEDLYEHDDGLWYSYEEEEEELDIVEEEEEAVIC